MSAIVLYALGIDIPDYDEHGFSSQIPAGIFPEVSDTYRSVIPRVIEFSPRETPDPHAENGLFAYIGEHRTRIALFCDNAMTNAVEKYPSHPHNLPKYYSAGVTGSRAELGRTGYVTFPDIKLGTHSFSVAVWLKVDRSLDEGVVVFANKDWFWKTRKSRGVGLSFRANDTVFSIGNGDDQEEFMAALPADTADDGWVHVIAVVDKKHMVYRLYYNFRPVIVLDIPEEYRDIADSDLPFTVGNDGTGSFSNEKYDLIVNLDDFFLFDGALTDVEVTAFGGYYGM